MPETVACSERATARRTAANQSPRIAILTNIISPYLKPVLDRLARRYVNLRILLSTPMEANRPWTLEWEGLDVVVQKTLTLNGLWRHPKGFRERLYLHFPLDTVSQLRRFDADVVISWEMGTRTMLAAVFRRIRRGTKLIVWAEFSEATESGRGRLRQVIRTLLHHAVDGFLVTGESGARYLRKLGVKASKIHKIAYTTEIDQFAAVNLIRPLQHDFRLLFVGQLIERKGLVPFVTALSHFASLHPERQLELYLAGDGPLGKQLQELGKPANLQLRFLGNSSYGDMSDIYGQAGIFVFPTLADTWGVVVNEAMASGLPVLGSLYGQAVSELVEDGVSGWTFRPDVDGEMYHAIERCLNLSSERLNEMRVEARAKALQLTPDSIADLIEAGIMATVNGEA